ncbi:serine hydrolase [Planctomyces sp. SH-PL62]|uniref:serine hydrolase n=1 Tax=Planctomyces sp. SH-PL62 TaxID=1636152 RepID=UPI00078B329B|nr:serine hydrolase [Planctomyces sp. SH-PL62]AMV40639.1 Extended-spectrum beta-lactamase PER-1 precursor [Planctomyces sp. SH-PL62]
MPRSSIVARFTLAFACLHAVAFAGDFEDEVAGLVAPFGPEAFVEVALHDLETGATVLIRADEPIHPASTMKVPVMLEVYRRAEAGEFGLDDAIEIKNTFASLVDGSPYSLDAADDSEPTLYKRIGGRAAIRELVFLMITESSNLATNLLIEKVSGESVTAFMKELGAGDLKVLRGVEDGKAFAKGLNNVGTARGTMTVLTRLAERTAVSKSASEAMLEVLRAQKFNEGVPALLPEGTIVAHKTGSITRINHDAAIVEPPGRKPFVLVVMTRGIEADRDARRLIAEIARAAYDHVVR